MTKLKARGPTWHVVVHDTGDEAMCCSCFHPGISSIFNIVVNFVLLVTAIAVDHQAAIVVALSGIILGSCSYRAAADKPRKTNKKVQLLYALSAFPLLMGAFIFDVRLFYGSPMFLGSIPDQCKKVNGCSNLGNFQVTEAAFRYSTTLKKSTPKCQCAEFE